MSNAVINQNVGITINWYLMYSAMENWFQYKWKWHKLKLVIMVTWSFFRRQHQFKCSQIMMKKKKEILVATWLTMFLFNKIFIKVLQSALYCFVLPCDFPSIRHIVIQKHFTYLFCSFSWIIRANLCEW